ncbi:MAG: Methyltransferase [Candidatus Tokpelaia sp. JSC188]|nr:MAG: Methyltransferase [Candidatus Tokpelaia sp. JSC188]
MRIIWAGVMSDIGNSCHVSVIALRSFYASLLGQHVQRTIADVLKCYYHAVFGERIIGLGYAIPYLEPFAHNAECCFACMPACQGASIWPSADCVATTLVFEENLPLPDASIDRVIMVHALEQTENAEETMRELWRILVPNGRLIIIVTNRCGFWAHTEFTPFGNGKPYSHHQLQNLLERSNFFCGPIRETLHFLPRRNWHPTSLSSLEEKFLQHLCPYFGGVLIIEAQKQLYKSLPVIRRSSRQFFSPASSVCRVQQKIFSHHNLSSMLINS